MPDFKSCKQTLLIFKGQHIHTSSSHSPQSLSNLFMVNIFNNWRHFSCSRTQGGRNPDCIHGNDIRPIYSALPFPTSSFLGYRQSPRHAFDRACPPKRCNFAVIGHAMPPPFQKCTLPPKTHCLFGLPFPPLSAQQASTPFQSHSFTKQF